MKGTLQCARRHSQMGSIYIRLIYKDATCVAQPLRISKQLTVVSPGVMGPEYFREVSPLLSAGGPPNPAAIAETMRRHGMIPVLPAPTAESTRR